MQFFLESKSLVKFLSFYLLIIFFLSSCHKDELFETDGTSKHLSSLEKDEQLLKFANTLSKAVYESKELRKFLKEESLKQFDQNYDVLYYLVKDKEIGGHTFRDILISHSSQEDIAEIEKSVPLLNIYVSKISFFNVLPENLDIEDNEIPIVVSTKTDNAFFLDGEEALRLPKGEIPDFHVFVVNENNRVIIPEKGSKRIIFKSPNFDGTRSIDRSNALRVDANYSVAGQKAIDAFKYFYKDDGSINQKGFQRDYIYYGITPDNRNGSLNTSITEYISFIEVNPTAYFTLSDQDDPNLKNNDPVIKTNSTSIEKRQLTHNEIMDRFWTKGAYNFKFEVVTSTSDRPATVTVPIRPDDIWDFNLDVSRRHSTWFRRTKYTYTINPDAFTAKKHFLDPVTIGKWDISKEALWKDVLIYEEDEGTETEVKETIKFADALKINFEGSQKISIGLKNIGSASAEGSASVTSSNTTEYEKTVTWKYKQSSNVIGKVRIYFYDPLIEGVSPSTNTYTMKTYNAGSLKFGITVK